MLCSVSMMTCGFEDFVYVTESSGEDGLCLQVLWAHLYRVCCMGAIWSAYYQDDPHSAFIV
jgi:hypothetical protein